MKTQKCFLFCTLLLVVVIVGIINIAYPQNTVEASPFATDIITGFREFMEFVRNRLNS